MTNNEQATNTQGVQVAKTEKQSFFYLLALLKRYVPTQKESNSSYKATAFAMLTGIREKRYDGSKSVTTLAKLSLPGATETIEVKVNGSDVADVTKLVKAIDTTSQPVPVKFTVTVYDENHVVNGTKVINGGRYCTVSLCDREDYNEFKAHVNAVNVKLMEQYSDEIDFDNM